jgi:hypothetical protein
VEVRRRAPTARTAALVAGGSAVIHQLRYAIGYGDDAHQALAVHNHAYLGALLPVVLAGVVLAMTLALLRVARGGRDARPRSFTRLWLGSSAALALIFTVQESLEGAGAFGGGGWIGLALAVPAGFLIALALRGADAAEPAAGRAPLTGFTVLMDRLPGRPRGLSAGRAAVPGRGARAPPPASFV